MHWGMSHYLGMKTRKYSKAKRAASRHISVVGLPCCRFHQRKFGQQSRSKAAVFGQVLFTLVQYEYQQAKFPVNAVAW